MSLLAQLLTAKWFLFAVCLVLYTAYKVQMYMRLRAFKGPFSTGWSELWHTTSILRKRSHLAYKEANDKYGKLSLM